MEKICDAVFEGGGMRGIGLVGAVAKFQKHGYKFRNVAGSSAGAIVAGLIAAGYTPQEMYEEMSKVNFEKFKQSSLPKAFGPLGILVGATKNFGLYCATSFEEWYDGLLAKKGVSTFGDVGGRLKLTASDVTDQRGLLLPNDLTHFGIDPKTFKISTAVRMSMGIPVFYEPYELIDKDGAIHYIVDGGMLSNYPIWILDDGSKRPDVAVIGFRFMRYPGEKRTKKTNLITYVKQIVSTIIEASDDEFGITIRGDKERTVYIDTKVGDTVVGITDFGMSSDQVESLYKNGVNAAEDFLESWDFKKWKKLYRNNQDSMLSKMKRSRIKKDEDWNETYPF